MAPAAAFAGESPALDCAWRAPPMQTMVQTQHVHVTSAAGWSRESVRLLRWKRFDDGTIKARIGVEAPKRDAGLEVLIVARPRMRPEIHVYTPDTGRARRMAGAGASASALGADVSFEDLQQIERLLDGLAGQPTRDGMHAGRAVAIIEPDAPNDDASSTRLRAIVDKRWCVPLAVEFFGADGVLEKTLQTAPDRIADVAGRRVPLETTVTNHQLGTRSTFIVSDIVIDEPLPDHLFTVQDIEQRG
ncbi:MAG: outer membrane lipoprotein-sorting protein [Gammaproteobacteria bacterium]